MTSRRTRACIAGVTTGAGVEALVILRARERQHVRAVRHDDEARFLAFEELLDHHLAPGCAEPAAKHRARRGERLLRCTGDHHALASGEPARLDHKRCTLAAHPCRIEALAGE